MHYLSRLQLLQIFAPGSWCHKVFGCSDAPESSYFIGYKLNTGKHLDYNRTSDQSVVVKIFWVVLFAISMIVSFPFFHLLRKDCLKMMV